MNKGTTEEKHLMPAFQERNVPVVLSCSEYYLPYGATFIRSLLRYRTSDHNYDIIIFTKDITQKGQAELYRMIEETDNVSIRFLNILPYIEKYQFKAHSHFGIESYFRLLMPYILDGYERAYYFDCDMVLRNDVAELDKVELGNAYLAGCLDTVIVGAINDPMDQSFGCQKSWKDYCTQKLKMGDPYRYLNSGSLIFNFKRFRQEYTADEILSFAAEKQFYLLDQDALNALCWKDVVILDHAWNMTNDNGGTKLPYIRKAPLALAQSYDKARENPSTVHYADKFKPWKNPNEDLGFEFWKDARETPFYSRILGRMSQELYERTVRTQGGTELVAMQYLPMGIKKECKYKIKEWSTCILPYGSKRRKRLKKLYFKIRGWTYSD